ncbi:MAG: M14 family metallopeptidase [Steroidobacteraceae bacterium]
MQAFFSEDLKAARSVFLSTCLQRGLDVETHRHPLAGPEGEPLFTDVTRLGPMDASRLLVLVSGVHGLEVLCGSACQSGWLAGEGFSGLPRDTAVLMVHAINCWGAAWGRRNSDGNVDLCRNFLDFSSPLPVRPIYEEVHEWLSCPDPEGPRRDAAMAALGRFHKERGQRVFMEALMGGQYAHPDGFEYGGAAPAWSNLTMGTILSRHAEKAEQVCIVEYHSGLGPWGYGSAVTMQTGSDLERVRRGFGGWTLPVNERDPHAPDEFYQVYGHTTEGYRRIMPHAQLTSIVLEFGTYPPQVSLPLLLQDHWLEHHGDPLDERGREIRGRLWEIHHPADPEWRHAVWDRSAQVIRQSLRLLSQ